MLFSMRIFTVYSKIELTQKPDWLDSFRTRYDKPYDYHVTLKQPCFLEEDFTYEVKAHLARFFQERLEPRTGIELVFTSLVKAREEHDGFMTIMINAEPNRLIEELQQGVVAALGSYRQYCKAESEQWEQNFHPHITIARNLPDDQLLLAERDLGSDLRCQGIIKNVVLTIVKEDTPEEARKPENRTVYAV
jgi:2'-5' RNA ligase